jgi:hypothetical protein
MTYRMLADGCPDGPCPKLRLDETTGDVIVQGYLIDQQPVPAPAGEGFLLIPASYWSLILDQLRA